MKQEKKKQNFFLVYDSENVHKYSTKTQHIIFLMPLFHNNPSQYPSKKSLEDRVCMSKIGENIFNDRRQTYQSLINELRVKIINKCKNTQLKRIQEDKKPFKIKEVETQNLFILQ